MPPDLGNARGTYLEMATSGIFARTESTKLKYASLVYPRFIRSSTDEDPLCAGM